MYQATQDTGDLRPCPPIEVIGFDVPGHEVRNVVFRDIVMANDRPGIVIKDAKDVSLVNVTSQQEV